MNEIIFEKQLEMIVSSLPTKNVNLYIELDKSILHISCATHEDKNKILEKLHAISTAVYDKLGIFNLSIWVEDELILELQLNSDAFNEDSKCLSLAKCAEILELDLEGFIELVENSKTQINFKSGQVVIPLNEFCNIVEYISEQYFEYCRDSFLEKANQYKNKHNNKKAVASALRSIINFFK